MTQIAPASSEQLAVRFFLPERKRALGCAMGGALGCAVGGAVGRAVGVQWDVHFAVDVQ